MNTIEIETQARELEQRRRELILNGPLDTIGAIEAKQRVLEAMKAEAAAADREAALEQRKAAVQADGTALSLQIAEYNTAARHQHELLTALFRKCLALGVRRVEFGNGSQWSNMPRPSDGIERIDRFVPGAPVVTRAEMVGAVVEVGGGK